MPALLLGETLLRAVAGPGVVDDPCAELLGDLLRAVGRAGIDDQKIVREVADGPDRIADPVGLVLGDDEDGKRKHGGGACLAAERRAGNTRSGPPAATAARGRRAAAASPTALSSAIRGKWSEAMRASGVRTGAAARTSTAPETKMWSRRRTGARVWKVACGSRSGSQSCASVSREAISRYERECGGALKSPSRTAGSAQAGWPIHSRPSEGLGLVQPLARAQRKVRVDDVELPAVELDLDPECAALLDRRPGREARQAAGAHHPRGVPAEDGDAELLPEDADRRLEMQVHAEPGRDRRGLVDAAAAHPADPHLLQRHDVRPAGGDDVGDTAGRDLPVRPEPAVDVVGQNSRRCFPVGRRVQVPASPPLARDPHSRPERAALPDRRGSTVSKPWCGARGPVPPGGLSAYPLVMGGRRRTAIRRERMQFSPEAMRSKVSRWASARSPARSRRPRRREGA